MAIWMPRGGMVVSEKDLRMTSEDPNSPIAPVEIPKIVSGLGGRTAPTAGGGIGTTDPSMLPVGHDTEIKEGNEK